MEHAVVRVYDTRSYKVTGEPLQGHILTVTRISFSPDDKLILTVSRDRTWRLFEASENGKYAIICCRCSQYLKHLIQAIFRLLLKGLMPVSFGIADGRLKEMYLQQRHETRRYLIVCAVPFPVFHPGHHLGENMESDWRKMEGCGHFNDWTTGHGSSIHFLEEK
jgi:hypothetical protein